MQYLDYDYDSMGNLKHQDNIVKKVKEEYGYDELMRVTSATHTMNGLNIGSVDYDDADADADADAGNITTKTDYGSNYLYGNKNKNAGGNAGPNAIRQFIRNGTTSTFSYDNNGNRLTGDGSNITYNDDNKPVRVQENGAISTFSYGADGMRFKQVKTESNKTVTTYYVGSFEREKNSTGTIDKTYISDHTVKMKAVSGSLGSLQPFQHILRDRLGGVDCCMMQEPNIKAMMCWQTKRCG